MTDSVGLPGGWAETELGAIRVDLSKTLDPRQAPDETFELYSVPSHAAGRPEIVRGDQIGSSKMTLVPGTVVVCKINPRINRVWVVGDHSPHKKIGSGEWIPFFPVGGVVPPFLAYYLQRDDFRNFLAARVSGVGGSLMRVRPTTLDEYPLPVPSIAEQQRIVEAIESYLTRLDNAVALLERVEENLKRYRASVLKAAVEGRLVPTEAALARREGRDYEPASELLERILAERKARWIKDNANKGRARQYKEPASPDTTDLSELPEGWCWASVEQLSSEIRYGYTASAVDGAAGPRFLRITDIQEGRVDWSLVPTCDIEPDDVKTYELVPGDVVFARTGATTGKSYLIGEAPKAVFASYLIRMRFPAGAEPEYMYLFFQSGAYWQEISAAKKGTGQPGVNATTLSGLYVPLSPEAEQRRIAEAAWSLITRNENVAATAAEQIRRAARLRQAILKWAFEGKLVEQDPNDESALVLLERIKAEREGAGAPKARGRTKRSTE
jgi:type I restriction enzyme S subunit